MAVKEHVRQSDRPHRCVLKVSDDQWSSMAQMNNCQTVFKALATRQCLLGSVRDMRNWLSSHLWFTHLTMSRSQYCSRQTATHM